MYHTFMAFVYGVNLYDKIVTNNDRIDMITNRDKIMFNIFRFIFILASIDLA